MATSDNDVYIHTYYIKHSLCASFKQETKPDGSAIISFLTVHHKFHACIVYVVVSIIWQCISSYYILNSVSIAQHTNANMKLTKMNWYKFFNLNHTIIYFTALTKGVTWQ